MSDTHTIALDVSNETHAFIKEAAEGKSVADFVRQAARKAASEKLGKSAPEEVIKARGKTSPFSAAAKAAGMTLEQYLKKVAVEHLGGTYVPPVKREKKIVPYVGDKPAEGSTETPKAEPPKVETKATPARPQAGLRRPAAR